MKRLLSLNLMVFMVLLMLSGCGHTHEFEDATCTEPKICKVCGEIDGNAAWSRIGRKQIVKIRKHVKDVGIPRGRHLDILLI